jgi:hypothetical protein
MSNTSPHPEDTAAHVVLLTATRNPSVSEKRLSLELEAQECQVTTCSLPVRRSTSAEHDGPMWGELRAGLSQLAQSLNSTLGGSQEAPSWLLEALKNEASDVDAVVTLNSKVARLIFPHIDSLWPNAIRIGVDGDYDLSESWYDVMLDDMVVPHPALGDKIRVIQDGRARLSIGGPLVGGTAAGVQSLEASLPMIAVSINTLDESDIDPLLFQLSMTHADNTMLLFLASGVSYMDELVKVKASQYGLRGKRPRLDADTEPWIAGAAALVGGPHPLEIAQAVQTQVPTVLFSNGRSLDSGQAFLVEHGAVLESRLAVTLSVDLESVLPGGTQREAVRDNMAILQGTGVQGISSAIKAAIDAGLPSKELAASTQGTGDLEDIGVPATSPHIPSVMGADMRRMYLSEVILKKKQIHAQIEKARSGQKLWTRRIELARTANRLELLTQAEHRLEGLDRVAAKLENQLARVLGLRDRLASNEALTTADRQSAGQLLGPSFVSVLNHNDTGSNLFAQLEVDDALQRLKDKLNDLS